MGSTRQNFTTPVGRLVAGSLSKPNDKDAEGRPLVVKSGPDAGKPRVDYFFALAIPKGTEQHWAQTEWGAKIWAAGHAFMAAAGQMPAFAWKVKDGDSQVPNRKGKKPCDNEGWPRSWVLMFSSGFAPKCYSLVGSNDPQPAAADAINLGDYVQVNGDVDGNNSPSQPGVYLNHNMVCLAGYGQRIVVGPDVSAAGFGGQPLPAGASMTPPAGFVPPVAAPVPSVPVPGSMQPPPPVVPPVYAPPVAVPATVGAQPVPPVITPNPAFLQVPGTPVPPQPPVPAPTVRRMSAAANGATYEQLIAVGWTDATLQQHGMFAA